VLILYIVSNPTLLIGSMVLASLLVSAVLLRVVASLNIGTQGIAPRLCLNLHKVIILWRYSSKAPKERESGASFGANKCAAWICGNMRGSALRCGFGLPQRVIEEESCGKVNIRIIG